MKNEATAQFLVKLNELDSHFNRRRSELAALLKTSPRHIIAVKKGENASDKFWEIVNRVHNEILLQNRLQEDVSEYKTGLQISDDVLKTVNHHAKEAGVSPLEFIETCLRDYSRNTRDYLINMKHFRRADIATSEGD